MNLTRAMQTLTALAASLPLAAQAAPALSFPHHNDPKDIEAIGAVLDRYTSSVSSGNQQAFEALLLDVKVPFLGVRDPNDASAGTEPVDTRRYDDFRQGVFASGRKLEQHFSNVHIEQDGAVAQASLDFVTKVAGTETGGYGWKVLQLLRVNGEWKIASEFYTAYPLPSN